MTHNKRGNGSARSRACDLEKMVFRAMLNLGDKQCLKSSREKQNFKSNRIRRRRNDHNVTQLIKGGGGNTAIFEEPPRSEMPCIRWTLSGATSLAPVRNCSDIISESPQRFAHWSCAASETRISRREWKLVYMAHPGTCLRCGCAGSGGGHRRRSALIQICGRRHALKRLGNTL